MRIRTVKPEFFTHPEIVRLSAWARILLLSLLTQADDEGRLYDQPRKIAGNAFGEGDVVDCELLLRELAKEGRIQRYSADGRRCIQVQNFTKHQRINRPLPSSIPAHAGLTEDSLNAQGSLTGGMEWRGTIDLPADAGETGWKPTPNGWTDTQTALVRKLQEHDPGWEKLTPSALNKLSLEFGKSLVTQALQHAWEDRVEAKQAYPLLAAICLKIKENS